MYMITFFVFTIAMSFLHARSQSEDYMMVKNWNLPEAAVLMQDLQLKDKVLYRENEAFTGWAYELYPEGELLRASEYRKGQQHGQSLLWYPDGSPQMSAFYRNGALHGRFLGWYQNGFVIYDMFINRGTYASDNLADSDERRAEEAEETEKEGNTDDATRE
jgi:antitoxin component YwqK of YwqJK toxin-antitoxin module